MIAGHIESVQTAWGAKAVLLSAPGGTAAVQLHGGHVVAWTPAGRARSVIWMPPEPKAVPGKATRGGVPVCWPWFGPASEPGKPAHGTVRTALWTVVDTGAEEQRAIVTLRPDAAALPAGVDVTLTVEVGNSLTLSLTTTNHRAVLFPLTEALHTYFAVPEVADVAVQGFDGASYLDQLDPGALKLQSGDIRFAEEVDRIYHAAPDPIRLVTGASGPTLEIRSTGSRSTVVWNPWADKAQRLGDLGPDGWRGMVCIETANARAANITVPAGGQHTLAATYRLA
jgi:glucose-6-phosphate 1-epimerase